MKFVLGLLCALFVSGVSGCASTHPDATQSVSESLPTVKVWRLDHQLTDEWQSAHPQIEFEPLTPDTPVGSRPSRATTRGFSVVNDVILKLFGDGTFEAHFTRTDGTAFAVSGEWTRHASASESLVDLSPHQSSQFSNSSLSPNEYVDSCVVLIDEANQRLRLLAIGTPDLILTSVE
ncbi:MAG: hypothetical protein ACIAQF_06045 [Phycisphaerales bacterium JB065]